MLSVIAETTRGGITESVHHGVVVAVDARGDIVASAGDPEQMVFFRSSAKPFQAIPVVESGAADAFGFTPAELALCCASHYAEPHHQQEVRAMLAKIGLDEGALRCGIPLPSDQEEAGRVLTGLVPRSPLQCDCSGKHSGMLATCVHLGYPTDTYLDPDHPAQRVIRGIIAEVCRVPIDSLRIGYDG